MDLWNGHRTAVTEGNWSSHDERVTKGTSAVGAETIVLVLLVGTALAFDFTNGFHDTGNAMATTIATGA